VCAGRENILAHHARAAGALASLKSPDWPYRGKVAIVETDASREATEVHVVDRWCYLGSARDEGEVGELIAAEPRFDYDHYRILARHVGRPGVRVRPLCN
jgi:DNA polymerase-3 subunit epsilon